MERKGLKSSMLSIAFKERILILLKLALRYAVVTLTSVGFALSTN